MQRTADLWRMQAQGVRVNDLVGYDVEATDGHIGKIDHATEETDRNSVVVDTGFWIFGKKRLIPAGVIQRVDDTNKKVYVAMTKDRVNKRSNLPSSKMPRQQQNAAASRASDFVVLKAVVSRHVARILASVSREHAEFG